MVEIHQEGASGTSTQGEGGGAVKSRRVTDLKEVKNLFRRPKKSKFVHPLGDEEFFRNVQEWIADSGAIIQATGSEEQLKKLQEEIEEKEE